MNKRHGSYRIAEETGENEKCQGDQKQTYSINEYKTGKYAINKQVSRNLGKKEGGANMDTDRISKFEKDTIHQQKKQREGEISRYSDVLPRENLRDGEISRYSDDLPREQQENRQNLINTQGNDQETTRTANIQLHLERDVTITALSDRIRVLERKLFKKRVVIEYFAKKYKKQYWKTRSKRNIPRSQWRKYLSEKEIPNQHLDQNKSESMCETDHLKIPTVTENDTLNKSEIRLEDRKQQASKYLGIDMSKIPDLKSKESIYDVLAHNPNRPCTEIKNYPIQFKANSTFSEYFTFLETFDVPFVLDFIDDQVKGHIENIMSKNHQSYIKNNYLGLIKAIFKHIFLRNNNQTENTIKTNRNLNQNFSAAQIKLVYTFFYCLGQVMSLNHLLIVLHDLFIFCTDYNLVFFCAYALLKKFDLSSYGNFPEMIQSPLSTVTVNPGKNSNTIHLEEGRQKNFKNCITPRVLQPDQKLDGCRKEYKNTTDVPCGFNIVQSDRKSHSKADVPKSDNQCSTKIQSKTKGPMSEIRSSNSKKRFKSISDDFKTEMFSSDIDLTIKKYKLDLSNRSPSESFLEQRAATEFLLCPHDDISNADSQILYTVFLHILSYQGLIMTDQNICPTLTSAIRKKKAWTVDLNLQYLLNKIINVKEYDDTLGVCIRMICAYMDWDWTYNTLVTSLLPGEIDKAFDDQSINELNEKFFTEIPETVRLYYLGIILELGYRMIGPHQSVVSISDHLKMYLVPDCTILPEKWKNGLIAAWTLRKIKFNDVQKWIKVHKRILDEDKYLSANF